MKKSYVRPTVFVQELSSAYIGTACGFVNPNPNEESMCGVDASIGNDLFTSDDDCFYTMDEVNELFGGNKEAAAQYYNSEFASGWAGCYYDHYCYHGPVEPDSGFPFSS